MTRVVLAPLGCLCEALGKPLLMPVVHEWSGWSPDGLVEETREPITNHHSLAACAWNRPFRGDMQKTHIPAKWWAGR